MWGRVWQCVAHLLQYLLTLCLGRCACRGRRTYDGAVPGGCAVPVSVVVLSGGRSCGRDDLGVNSLLLADAQGDPRCEPDKADTAKDVEDGRPVERADDERRREQRDDGAGLHVSGATLTAVRGGQRLSMREHLMSWLACHPGGWAMVRAAEAMHGMGSHAEAGARKVCVHCRL